MKDMILSLLTKISPELNTRVLYKKRLGKKINLKDPKTFNEKIQWLKLNVYPKNKKISICADKYLVRNYIKDIGCEEILNDLYGVYDDSKEIDWEKLPDRFVLKWNFGCGHNIICNNKKEMNEQEVKQKLNKWKHNKFYLKSSELHYGNIPKKIICEQNLNIDDNKMLDDYKFYCFNGKVDCVMICIGREKGTPSFYFLDRDWQILRVNKMGSSIKGEHNIKKPQNIDLMFDYAEKLCSEFSFVRVDLYNINGKIIFGEYTFTPSAGLDMGYTEEGALYFGNKINIEGFKKHNK